MKIINVWDYSAGMDAAVKYIHGLWGNAANYNFYYDAISHSSNTGQGLPRFYLLMDEDIIAGCYALLTNDLVSRQDLVPWLGCLYVEPAYRGRQLGEVLLNNGIEEAKRMGYKAVYLTTDHDGYYERYGWERIEDAYNLFGEQGRVYRHRV
jgi:GNAT superfamily N-acetyltransferase